MTITDAHRAWADEVTETLRAAGVRVELDPRNEKLGLKIREATLLRVPYMLVLGDREVEAREVAPRRRDGKTEASMSLQDFKTRLLDEVRLPS